MVARARAAEAAGLDSLFVGDHHVTPRPYYQNSPILGRLLAEWGERPCGALYLLPLWHPVLVAEQVGTLAAIARGLHVICTKPIVMKLADHVKIVAAAKKAGVLVDIEVHKRYDFIYADARSKIREMGDCGHFVSYMSQPKFQLETFRAWAGRSSDIRYASCFLSHSDEVQSLCFALC